MEDAVWKDAGTEWVEELQQQVKRYCLTLTDNRWEAEDLAQECWLKGWRTLAGSGHANPKAFLLRVAKSTWIDQVRRSKRQRRMIDQIRKESVLPPEADFLELERMLQALWKHLTPLQRAVFLLKDVYGCPVGEMAHRLATTPGAVKSALHRARQALGEVKLDLGGIRNPLQPPRDETGIHLLRNLASALQGGDIETVIALALHNEMEPEVALATIRRQRIAPSVQARFRDTLISPRMAA